MNAKEKVLKIRPHAYYDDSGHSIYIRDSETDEVIVRMHIRRESWAWAAALRQLIRPVGGEE